MPNVMIPKEFKTRKKLIAVPEREYRQFRTVMYPSDQEVRDVLEAEAEIRAGQVIRAASAAEALKKARARGWVDSD